MHKDPNIEVIPRPMKIRRLLVPLFGFMVATGGHAESPPQMDAYSVLTLIPGPDIAGWDHATIDARRRRLYLPGIGLTVVDLESQAVTPQFIHESELASHMTHSVTQLDDRAAALTDATNNTVTFFDADTGKILSQVFTGKPPKSGDFHNPDGLVLEPKTGLLVAINSDSGTAIDTIVVGGELSAAVAGERGMVYVDSESTNSIKFIDILKRRLVRTVALRHCSGPSGIDYDPLDHLIIAVCGNGVATFIDAKSGREIASLKVGKGADGVSYDRIRRVAFSPGADGVLDILTVRGRRDIAVRQSLRTPTGSRLGALDELTGRFYIPSVHFAPNLPRIALSGISATLPAIVPNSFGFLAIGIARAPETGPR
jgi:hypothetical protein